MYAIIKTGGKQYRVEKDMILNVDKLAQEEGADFETSEVLFVKSGENDFKTGTPYVAGAKVTGKIVSHYKDKKIVIFKKKRRKGYKKTQGHRQNYTKIQITDIQA
ncbi:MAG: 50S ribosomal protein L21 [bacterium]|nr:50S ribosomal protein L21 [bacterium]